MLVIVRCSQWVGLISTTRVLCKFPFHFPRAGARCGGVHASNKKRTTEIGTPKKRWASPQPGYHAEGHLLNETQTSRDFKCCYIQHSIRVVLLIRTQNQEK